MVEKKTAVYIRINPYQDENAIIADVKAGLSALDLSTSGVEIYQDRAHVIKGSRKRIGFQNLVKDIKAGLVQKVVVLSWSMVAGNAHELLWFGRICAKAGSEFISLTEPLTWESLAEFMPSVVREACEVAYRKKACVPNTEASR